MSHFNCGQYCGCNKVNPIIKANNEMSWNTKSNKTGHSCTTTIRDQGHDGRCNIHALMAATETYIYISGFDKTNFDKIIDYSKRHDWKSKNTNHLSVQYLIQYGHSLIAGSVKTPGGNNLWLSEILNIEKPVNDKYKIYKKLFLEKDIPYDISDRSKLKDIHKIKNTPLNINFIGCGYFKRDNSLKITKIHEILKKTFNRLWPNYNGS